MSQDATPATIDDHRAEDAQERIRQCPYTILRRVRCAIQNDVLVLTGVVPTYYGKQIAQELLRDLDSIAGIDNQLVVSN